MQRNGRMIQDTPGPPGNRTGIGPEKQNGGHRQCHQLMTYNSIRHIVQILCFPVIRRHLPYKTYVPYPEYKLA